MQYTNESFLIDGHCNENGNAISEKLADTLDEQTDDSQNNHTNDENSARKSSISSEQGDRDKNRELIAALEISTCEAS